MATYTLAELRHTWATGELTVEQLLGHQLQHLLILEEELTQVKQPGALRARQLEAPRPAAGKPQR